MHLMHRPLEIIWPTSRNYGRGHATAKAWCSTELDSPVLPTLVRGSLTADASALDRPFYQAGPSSHRVAVLSLKTHFRLVGAAWPWKALAFSSARGLWTWEIRRLRYDSTTHGTSH